MTILQVRHAPHDNPKSCHAEHDLRECQVKPSSESICCFAVSSLVGIACLLMFGCQSGEPEANKDHQATKATESIEDLEQVNRLIQAGDFDAAREVLERYLLQHPSDSRALEMAGDGAMQANDLSTAVEFFEAAVRSTDQPTADLWFKWAGATMAAERPFDAIAVLREAVGSHPNVIQIRQNLASLLARVGLQNEAAEHLQWLVQRKHASQSVLFILSDLTRSQAFDADCESALRRNPDDLRPIFSLVQADAAASNWFQVRDRLRPVVERHPDFLPAVALYGRAIVELDENNAIEAWVESLPQGIEAYSQYWIAAAIWAHRHGSMEQAARAYWSAVRLSEDDSESLHGLAVSLQQLGRQKEAELAAGRAKRIAALRGHIATLMTWDFNSQKTAVEVAQILNQLGRPWEAANWLLLGQSMQQHPDPRLEPTYLAIRQELKGSTPWQLPDQRISTLIDLSSFPAVAWGRATRPGMPPIRSEIDRLIRFRDEASTRSLDHVCDIGKSAGRESDLMIYQSGAGGVGVIDFDLDGWPDLYLTVMDGTPERDDSGPNRLFQNHMGSFKDVTEHSSLIDLGFAQGIAVGDYNADGWPDVYVANIGKNRLYQNNGDGTFRDVTSDCGIDATGWTTSVGIADLNGDGHADIFEVGYCRGERPLKEKCVVPSIGEPRSCNPMAFDPESDRIWMGNGDGTFSNATDWLGPHEAGRGFALVIGDLDHDPGLEIYVANDMTANHYWDVPADESSFRLVDQAPIRGLAFNGRSMAQASMGIAAADADQDGDIDFLLTHFVDDYNTYYRQVGPGIWSDESRVAGFAEPSRATLAYGTQWIDADNDGFLEVFIANGDIDDFQFEGRSFRQPAQFMRQIARGRWQVMQADSIGDYFTRTRLARAVAALDANRDGLSDIVVTHLFDPVSLLVNRSEAAGKQVRFWLRARSTHRDAIGARIAFRCGEQSFQQPLLAGNGFQCANEACIVFGISDAEILEDVRVIWPGGTGQSLGDLDASGDYLVVEGLDVTPIGQSAPDAG